MDITRILTGLIGFPIVVLVLVFGNTILIDIAFAIIAALALHEYYKCFREKEKAKPITWVGYLACTLIAFIHIIPQEFLIHIIGIIIPIFILILFIKVIFSNMKTSIKDIAVTMLGICYIPLFLMFIPIIRGLENGICLVLYLILAAWGTDVFAFTAGRLIGKHKFSEISPNKTIEGCIGGIIGAVIMNLGYTWIINTFCQMSFSYLAIIGITIILSLLSQVGDFAASAIKRYVGVKDFSNLIPGHGGMLDRIDSLIFIAPFAFYLLRLLV